MNRDMIRIMEHAGGSYGSITCTVSPVAGRASDAGTAKLSADEEEANMVLLLRPSRLSVEVYERSVCASSLDRFKRPDA